MSDARRAGDLEVRDLVADDVDGAAALLAGRQRLARARIDPLPASFEQADGCSPLVRELWSRPAVSGVVVVRAGTIVGFVLAEAVLPKPRSLVAYFFEPGTMHVPAHGHAVASDEDPAAVYRAAYTRLSARWVEQGALHHTVNVTAGMADVERAWFDLGFGVSVVAASRPTGAISGDACAPVEVRSVDEGAMGDVTRLSDELRRYQSEAPMFHPNPAATDDAWHRLHADVLASAALQQFVAYRDGKPVGMQTFMPPDMISPLHVPERSVYLLEGVVTRAERGAGVANALLAESMRWAAGAGYEHCTLHYLSANVSGAPFWLAHGFEPVDLALSRRIDERIAWAGPGRPALAN